MALLICCRARNNVHVGDLYPASSKTLVRFVSFRIVVIRPSQHSFFSRKFHPTLVIVHPCPGARHVVRPSVVMILVSSICFSNTSDDSDKTTRWNLLVQEPSLCITAAFLAHEEDEGHMQLWHRGSFPLHVSTHELRAFLVK